MIIYERQQEILKYLEKKKFATFKELSELVWTSESSVRRDVKALVQKGILRQIYGGVTFPEHENTVVPVDLRDQENAQIKEALAKKAAKMIPDGATIIMDGSSTVRRIVKYVGGIRDLKIITNNIKILHECNDPSVKIYCTGGLFLHSSNIFIGSAAENYINSINADIVFFSSQAISNSGEISDSSEEETSLRRAMLAKSKRKIFLCDSSKLGQKKMFSLCDKNDIDEIICDTPLPWCSN
jgi:DeoR/GlpR family transcriptional regulator of sugar metabolism